MAVAFGIFTHCFIMAVLCRVSQAWMMAAHSHFRMCVQRLMRDFKKIRAEQRTGLEASPNPTNIMQWNAVMAGPEDTPWDGGDLPCSVLTSCHLLLLLIIPSHAATRSLSSRTKEKHPCSCSTGQFKLTMEFTEQYPNEPPKVKFLSALYHPNGKAPIAPCLCCYRLVSVFKQRRSW